MRSWKYSTTPETPHILFSNVLLSSLESKFCDRVWQAWSWSHHYRHLSCSVESVHCSQERLAIIGTEEEKRILRLWTMIIYGWECDSAVLRQSLAACVFNLPSDPGHCRHWWPGGPWGMGHVTVGEDNGTIYCCHGGSFLQLILNIPETWKRLARALLRCEAGHISQSDHRYWF